MASNPSKIQRAIDEGYNFDLGAYISKGFDLLMKNPGGFIGFILVMFVILGVVGSVPFVGSIASAAITPVVLMGGAHVAHKIDLGKPFEFGDFFRGFDKIGDLAVVGLLTWLLTVAAIIPGAIVFFVALFSSLDGLAGTAASDDPTELFRIMFSSITSPLALVGLILIMVPAIYVSISFIWAPYMVWFFDLKGWEAMQASRKLAAKNFWWTLLFLIAAGFVGAAGIILLFIGILFTLPATYNAMYAAFADITRLNEDTEDEQVDVLDHFGPTV